MQHELHPAGFVEETLQHETFLRRNRAEDLTGGREVLDDGPGTGLVEAYARDQPLDRGRWIVQPVGDILAQPGDFF